MSRLAQHNVQFTRRRTIDIILGLRQAISFFVAKSCKVLPLLTRCSMVELCHRCAPPLHSRAGNLLLWTAMLYVIDCYTFTL